MNNNHRLSCEAFKPRLVAKVEDPTPSLPSGSQVRTVGTTLEPHGSPRRVIRKGPRGHRVALRKSSGTFLKPKKQRYVAQIYRNPSSQLGGRAGPPSTLPPTAFLTHPGAQKPLTPHPITPSLPNPVMLGGLSVIH